MASMYEQFSSYVQSTIILRNHIIEQMEPLDWIATLQ